MEKRILRIGTRGSRLALAQAKQIKRLLEQKFPRQKCKLVIIKTTGDEFQGVEIFQKNGIGVFTKVIEEKLLAKKVDIAVHSLKDLPTGLPKGLVLGAYPKRLDASDVLISKNRHTLKNLPKGSLVGTGSPRRKRQILLARPDLKVVDIRGNLDTRVLQVVRHKKYDAVIVARAGLLRINKYLQYASTISQKVIMPAVGQASLGMEIREGDKDVLNWVKKLNHAPTEKLVLAERSFLKGLRGGCRVPAGIYSEIKNGVLLLRAAVFSPHTQDHVSAEMVGPVKNSEKIGFNLAKKLLKKGAGRFLKEARGQI